MQWIQTFTDSKIPFYIYQLNKGDYITTSNKFADKALIIVYGIACITKIFTNQEIVVLAILKKNDLIKESQKTEYYNYSIIAIEKTFIISFTWKDVIKNKYIKYSFFTRILNSYENTLNQYEKMNSILSHKTAKNRIIQLILFLCQEFCVIENTITILPFHISQTTIGIIIGSNKSTVNRIISELCQGNIISYSYNKYIRIKDPFMLSYCYNNKQN